MEEKKAKSWLKKLRLTTFAEKIVNHGGGWKTRDVWIPEKFLIADTDLETGKQKTVEKKMMVKRQSFEKHSGTDYIVFNCPFCQQRNKRSAYDAEVEDKGTVLAFRCNKCYNAVEVKRPMDLSVSPEEMIVQRPGGLLGPDGKVIS